ncbi:MAG: DUF4286 family protein [Muribaculaceae bacterium]|nr:DUF4286 family protein [Muribaculaceae bacterium]
MFVVNTTFCADRSVAIELEMWCTAIYATQAKAYGFTDVIVCRILSADAAVDSESLAVQMQCDDTRRIDQWFDSIGEKLLDECRKKWGEKVIPFTTYMSRIL